MAEYRPLTLTRTIVAILLLSLSACGGSHTARTGPGSGGGGGGGGGGLPAPDPLASKQPASNFTSAADFDPCMTAVGGTTYCNLGLGQIGAANVYAEGAYGSGVVVAVVDTGIDTTHTELDGNISALSKDIVSPGTPLADEQGHGTMVAGVIAAERNNIGTHGVAFGSTILAVRADARNPDGSSAGYFLIPDVTAAINYAAGKAHVINLSLGVIGTTIADSLGPEFEQALVDAMAAGAIIVVATGNESATEASQPAAYAGDATVNASGQMIAVGATNHDGTALAGFSNWCGQAMNYCLVAPGDGIWTTYPGNTWAYVGGTSFAAPYVSGAAALLIQLWPMLTAAEVVNILLTTATDMGDPGVDVVYGWGMLNLQAALTPAGALEIVLTDSVTGETVMLEGTGLSLGSAFGDALSNSDLLSRTFVLDDYDRNYGVDLNDMIVRPTRGFGLEALLGSGGIETVEAVLPNGMKVAMGVSEQEETENPANWAGMAADANDTQEMHGFSLSFESSPGTQVQFGYDITPEQQMAGLAASEPVGLFWMPGDMLGPQQALVGAGTGFSVSRQVDTSSVVSLSFVDQKDDPDLLRRDARIGEIMLAHRFGNGATGYAGFSLVDEQGGFLGSDAAGGLAVDGADTQFYSLGGRYPLGAGLELVGNYTLGRASMREDGSSLLGDWSDIRADAFGAGVVKTGVLGSRDRIGLLAGQPLRVSSGAATVTAPVEYLIDKTVVQESERLSMTPTGREVDLQLAYGAPLGDIASLSTWIMMQMEPGHVADADTAYGVGFRFSAEF